MNQIEKEKRERKKADFMSGNEMKVEQQRQYQRLLRAQTILEFRELFD